MSLIDNRCSRGICQYFSLFMLVLVSSLLGACQTDLENNAKEENTKYINLQLQSYEVVNGATNGPQNRESRIDNVVALVFDEANTFVYRAQATTPVYNSKTNKYDVNISLAESSNNEKYSVSILANSTVEGNLRHMVGKNKKNVLASFTYDSGLNKETAIYPWVESDLSFPMYGETEYKEITSSTSFSKSLKLMRALSKVDIFLNKNKMDASEHTNFDEGTAKNYHLNSVYIFNSVAEGKVTPNLFVTETQTSWEGFTPNTPFMSYGSDGEINYNPMIEVKYNAKKHTLDKSLYVSENYGGDRLGNLSATIFIVGLVKDETPEVATRYYRLEVRDDINSDRLADLIRNCHYKVLIKDVEGEGSQTPEEAATSKDYCDAYLSIEEWVTKSIDTYLNGKEYFEIPQRELFFDKIESQKIQFKTNLEDIALNWTSDRNEANNSIISDNYYISFVKTESNNTGILTISALKETAESMDKIKTEFYVFAGNMIIPMTIYQKEQVVNLENKILTSCVPHGFYVSNNPADIARNYLEFIIPASSQIEVQSKDGKVINREVNIELGDYISVESTKDAGFEFKIENHKVVFEDLISSVNEEGITEYFVSLKVPVVKGSVVHFDREKAQFNVTYKISQKTGDFVGEHQDMINIDILSIRPDFYASPKVLIVGETYSFDPKIIYNYWDSRYYDVNLARLLLNEGVFGLSNFCAVKMESFSYKSGNTTKVRNLNHVNSFRELGNPSELDKYNIIFYLGSEVEDEILDGTNIYVQRLVKRIKDKKIVFVQTPSRHSRLTGAANYNDPILSAMASQEVKVNQTDAMKQMALSVEIENSALKAKVGWTYNNRVTSIESSRIFFPSRDKKTLFKFLNIFANFRDSSFLEDEYKEGYDLEQIGEYRPGGVPGKKSKKCMAVKSTKYAYMWLGNTSVFADSAFEINRQYYPASQSSDNFSGISDSWFNTITYNSPFFVNVMKWAMRELAKIQDAEEKSNK